MLNNTNHYTLGIYVTKVLSKYIYIQIRQQIDSNFEIIETMKYAETNFDYYDDVNPLSQILV